jgi:hypothetical protein
MMPQLQRVRLADCGRLVPDAADALDFQQQQWQQMPAPEELQALAKVRRLLRPGLVLEVCIGYQTL